jgi:hypothetical protein
MNRDDIVRMARLAATGAAPLAIFTIEELEAFATLVAAHNRQKINPTPACPNGITEFECEVEGVELVCHLEYMPEELGSLDGDGLPSEPDYAETMELVNAYVKGTDIDIGHLLLQGIVDHITTTALEDFKNDDL